MDRKEQQNVKMLQQVVCKNEAIIYIDMQNNENRLFVNFTIYGGITIYTTHCMLTEVI